MCLSAKKPLITGSHLQLRALFHDLSPNIYCYGLHKLLLLKSKSEQEAKTCNRIGCNECALLLFMRQI